jgi:F0F1-type ATP synthase, gamma subunit
MAIKGGIKFLRKRIRAVRNIKKLTKAMKTVASVRLRKSQPLLLNSKEFIEDLEKDFHCLTRA